MTIKTDNLGRIVHDPSGIVLGIRSNGVDTYMPAIIAQSGVASSVTGTTAETTLASITIPGGAMGPNGTVRVTAFFSCTNNANVKTALVKLGAMSPGAALANSATDQIIAIFRNAGTTAAQKAYQGGTGVGAITGLKQSATLDMTQDQVLTITGTLATAADTITLEGYTVEILPGA